MQFKVKAARSGEGMVYVDIDALTKDDAMRQAADLGLTVLSLTPMKLLLSAPNCLIRAFHFLYLAKSC